MASFYINLNFNCRHCVLMIKMVKSATQMSNVLITLTEKNHSKTQISVRKTLGKLGVQGGALEFALLANTL